MLFQKNIVRKYLTALPKEQTNEAWSQYQQYFLNPAIQQNILQSKEEQFQEGFLRELFVKILGYTLNPSPDYNLITEQKNEANSKKADGAILLDGKVIGIIELKDHKTTDLAKIEAQAFGYKSQHVGTRLVIISNFEKLRLYIDNAVEYREWNLFSLTEDEFRELYLCLAWPQVKAGIALQMKSASVSSEDQITKSLYKDYSEFKRVLFADIVEHNPDYDKLLLFKKTQKLLDRLLFIFFAEDCGLLPPNSMMQIIDQWEKLKEMDEYRPFYDRVKKYFGYMNTGFQGKKYEIFAYNGGLFKPDEVLDNILISDEPLVAHTKRLSTYDFESEVDVNILGHIFENSLSEIEEVTQQIKEEALPSAESKTTSKRKQDGVFYTPQYITKYIVENTVGRLCAEKKSELGIVDEEYFSDKKRLKETRKRLMEQLQQYREWLLQITICDPACGSGAFLNAALQFLMNEHRLIDEMEAKVTGANIVFQNVENSILENNLFGVDINEESVEIAQLALWLRTAKPHRKLNTLNQNIKCGNSLISDPAIAGDKAFNWQEQFPKVFEKGGFDVVIGNPPYVNAIELKKSYSDEEYNYLKKHYSTAKGTVDLYIYFFEKGLTLLKPYGVLAYITPNRYLSASYGTALRQLIINNYSFYQLIDYSDKKVFEDASTYPVITMLQNGTNDSVLCGKFNDDHELISKQYPSDKLDILENTILGFLLNDKLTITQKIIKQSQPLSAVGEINATSTAKEADDYALLITEENCGYKLINTGTIDPFFTMWGISTLTKQGKQYLKPYLPSNNNTISPNRHALYSSSKIIISKIGLSCEAFYDKQGEYASIDTNCIHSFNEEFIPEYVLCWINSKLYNYMFECLFDGLRMSGGYLLYSSPNLKNTYIKVIPKESQQPFIALADTMLSLNSQLQQKRSRFLRRLQENLCACSAVKITGTLETFDTLSFADFLKELKKQKIKLTLLQQDEWEDYFGQYKTECDTISEQITETDRKIDGMVYKLYGLTEEEIKVVEGK
ncbi:MAG: Eco57I restriction-modification methylase domain-containing protein [Bacteroidales bacterium]|nr:Eco57I restriction-modification methylase domain-containing protein [Bacteroidales bacterium]